ncbi:MAG: hypothetical protein KAY24_10440 [Candidatus Eisenbacteria sp.]|nr:hypothetical protein [Candidatus Eisenbacteria bacterium]
MTDQEILDTMQPLLKNGMLRCKDALALAAELQIKPNLIGRVCNLNDIRIINCQLGCFGTGPKKRS